MNTLIFPEVFTPAGSDLNQRLLGWCSSLIHGNPAFGMGSVAIGITDGTDLIAVVVYDNFRRSPSGKPLSIELSAAAVSPKWLTRSTIKTIFEYAFCQLGVQRITTLIADTNERSIKVTKGLGFSIEGHLRNALEDGSGLYLTGLVREEARRWLGDLIDGQ